MNNVGQISGTSERRPYAFLSFVGDDGAIWAPRGTGDYSRDNALGRFYANELLTYIRDTDCPFILGYICNAIQKVEWTGVEVGFFHQISADILAAQEVRSIN